MSQAPRFLLRLPPALLALALLGSGVAGFEERVDRGRDASFASFTKLKHGMTPEQVRQIVGAPRHIARQILYHRYREQWIYEMAMPVRLTFDCPRGQTPQLLSWSGVPIDKGGTHAQQKINRSRFP